MMKLNLNSRDSVGKILCLGAHSDDIEIGCGGTVLRLIEDLKDLQFCWVVFSANEERRHEALKSADAFLAGAREKNVLVKDFRESIFPSQGPKIKEYFEELKHELSPDVIFTHHRTDLHQDHRVVSDLTWNTFRDHLILEYEIPKYDGDLGQPNLFVHLDDAIVERKIGSILSCFQTQRDKHWFDRDTFRATLRLRGVESCAPQRFAEGFYCRKGVWELGQR